MKAIILDSFGGPENMRLDTVDDPVATGDQVLIDVRASSVNRPDIVQRQGNYPPPRGDSEILGLEVSGVVSAVGPDVSRWAPGDRVMALVGGGGYAEKAVACEGHVMAIPEGMDFHQAACIPETYITAWLNVFQLGRLVDTERVLIHGGGGGVSTAAIQLVRNLTPQCEIVVTASTGKCERVHAQGAHHVIDYRKQSFADEIKALSDGKGVDVILDHIGASYLAANMKSLAVNGRLVVIGVMRGIRAELNLGLLMVKRQQILGSVLRSRPVEEKSAIITGFSDAVLPLFAAGTIAPEISTVLPLDKAAEGHRQMEDGAHFGKIVLSMTD